MRTFKNEMEKLKQIFRCNYNQTIASIIVYFV